MEESIAGAITDIEQIVETFYTDEASGYLLLSTAIQQIQQILSTFLELFAANTDEASLQWCSEVRNHITELAEAVRYHDTVRIADILQYRIADVLQGLLQILTEPEE